jgi:succinate-semialdehyde dehydrogenase/glutarate-semialdehyde dehydrogenase
MSVDITYPRTGFDRDLIEALLTIPVVHPGASRHASLAPFDGEPLVELPYSTVEDVDMAFDTARVAQVRWATTPVVERKRVMLRFHDLLLSHRDEGLDLIQWETGKTRMDALKELLGVCTVARHYARDARRLLSSDRKVGLFPLLTKVSVEHHPVGVVGDISPWNPGAHGGQRRGAQARPSDLPDRPVGRGPDAPRRHPAPGHAGRARLRP